MYWTIPFYGISNSSSAMMCSAEAIDEFIPDNIIALFNKYY
jgi:hypothetical protein